MHTDSFPAPESISLAAPAFDEEKLLVYRELYYDGFSSLIAARDLTSGGAVAVKRVEYDYLKPSPFPIQQLQRRYTKKIRRQAARIRAISHNSVLRLIEFVVEPNRMIIVTEMCMFGDLFNWMLQQPHLRIRDLCLIIQYIFHVLHYLHSRDMVHGNLSPTHILFQSMSPQSVTVMPDLSVRTEMIRMSRKTPEILDCWAPEQLKNFMAKIKRKSSQDMGGLEEDEAERKVESNNLSNTKAMDIWSVGMIALIAMTGKSLFETNCPIKLLNLFESEGTNPSNPFIRTFSSKLQCQISSMLSMDPNDRPTSDQGPETYWLNDEDTKNDNRNILLTIEFDLMNTCRRYRTQGRKLFEKIFSPNPMTDEPMPINVLREE